MAGAQTAGPMGESAMQHDDGGPPGCLAGLRVVELGQVLAAPFGGMIFCDLGAEVI